MSPEGEEELREKATCQVCLEVRQEGKIFQCERGHLICEKCRNDLRSRPRQCPTCASVLSMEDGVGRCLLAEQLRDMLSFPCR